MAAQPRSIASLTMSFGLVAIPVKLYSATNPAERISFHLVRASDGSRVKQQYVAAKDGKPVERAEMAKAYEFAKDQHVVFGSDELKALEEATTHSIDIHQFVPLSSVDPVYFDTTYYLAPDKGGAKPYSLLVAALERTQQCALGRWVSRGRESIVAIRPVEHGLALHQLRFQTEVRDMKDLGLEAGTPSDAELKLAEQLIDHLSAKRFDPNEYHNEFKQRVEAAIQRKVAGKEVAISEAPVRESGNVVDLMAALKASLDARGDQPQARERRQPRKASGRAGKTTRRSKAAG